MPTRRALIGASVTGLAVAIAGCGGDSGTENSTGGDGDSNGGNRAPAAVVATGANPSNCQRRGARTARLRQTR